MLVADLPLTEYGGWLLDPNRDCEFCGRSLAARFGGIVGDECPSCAAEFKLLNGAGKLVLVEQGRNGR